MPAGPPRYPTEDFTTQPERFFAAEIVREKVLAHTSDELPYTTAVAVDRFEEDEAKNLIKIYATIVVERETQKPIIIGKRGDDDQDDRHRGARGARIDPRREGLSRPARRRPRAMARGRAFPRRTRLAADA